MTTEPTDTLANALVVARRNGTALYAAAWGDTLSDAAQAYRAQDAIAHKLGWFGDSAPQCWKSGGGSRTATLTHAPLPPEGVRRSPAKFDDMVFHSPGLEAEIALRLGKDVTPEDALALTPENAPALIETLTVSVEIVDSRWKDPSTTSPLLKLADSQSHGALALSPHWVPYAAGAIDWAAQRCEVRIGDREPIVRTGTHPLGDPAWLLPTWLKHATRDGRTISAGTVVTTGSWVGILPLARGDEATVVFDGIGSLSLRV